MAQEWHHRTHRQHTAWPHMVLPIRGTSSHTRVLFHGKHCKKPECVRDTSRGSNRQHTSQRSRLNSLSMWFRPLYSGARRRRSRTNLCSNFHVRGWSHLELCVHTLKREAMSVPSNNIIILSTMSCGSVANDITKSFLPLSVTPSRPDQVLLSRRTVHFFAAHAAQCRPWCQLECV